MTFDNDLIAGKLRRWEKYLDRFRLPEWEEIPDIGLYMEQVVLLLRQYLDYLPPELKESQCITSSSINNYVRMHVMPMPVKKRYYRTHIAYLIVICTLKQSLSLAMIQKILPMGLSPGEVRAAYDSYVQRHRLTARFFTEQVRAAAGFILRHDDADELAAQDTGELITSALIVSGFSRLLAEKLLLLDGVPLESGGRIEPEAPDEAPAP